MAESMRRIGVLLNLAADDVEGQARVPAAFAQGLKELGWSEGHNQVDTRWATGDAPRFVDTRRNWSRLRRTSSWLMARHPWLRCFRLHAPCRSCSWVSSIRLAPALSIVCHVRAAMPPVSVRSNTV